MVVPVSDLDLIEYAMKPLDYTCFGCKWIPKKASIVSCGENHKTEGIIEIYELEESKLISTGKTIVEAGVKCCTFGAYGDPNKLACGSFRGDVYVQDLNTQTQAWKGNDSHTGIVNCIDACGTGGADYGARELVTTSRDGQVKVWDVRQPEPVVSLKPESSKADGWAACFGNAHNSSERCIVAGYDNGDMKMLDLRTMTIKWETHLDHGICHLAFDRKDIAMNKLVASCVDGFMCAFDMRTYNPVSGFVHTAHKLAESTLWGCYPMPQDREVLAATCGDGSVRICKYEYPIQRKAKDSEGMDIGIAGAIQEVFIAEKFATQPVISFDWHPEKKGLIASSTFDQTLRVAYYIGH